MCIYFQNNFNLTKFRKLIFNFENLQNLIKFIHLISFKLKKIIIKEFQELNTTPIIQITFGLEILRNLEYHFNLCNLEPLITLIMKDSTWKSSGISLVFSHFQFIVDFQFPNYFCFLFVISSPQTDFIINLFPLKQLNLMTFYKIDTFQYYGLCVQCHNRTFEIN